MDLTSLVPDLEKLAHFAFLWEISLVLVAVLLAGYLSRKIGQPAVFGQLLVGVILGPAMLGWLEQTPLLKELSEVGVILLMFLAGLETDVSEFRKNAGVASLVAVLGVVAPFAGGWFMADLWGYPAKTAAFTGVLLVATSVSISVQTLRELGRLRSREGVTILAAAVLDDVLGLITLSVVLGLVAGGEGGGAGGAGIAALLIKIVIFFILAALVGRYLMPPILRWFGRFPLPAAQQSVGIAVALSFGFLAEGFGLAAIVGAYLAGLALAASGGMEKLYHDLEHTAFAFFVPFFFAGVGLVVELEGLTGSALLFITVLSVVAILTKVLGCGAGALLGKFSFRSALGVGSGMVARGEVGLIVAAIGLERGLIGPELFTAMVVVALVTTLVTPPMLKAIFRKPAGADAGQAPEPSSHGD